MSRVTSLRLLLPLRGNVKRSHNYLCSRCKLQKLAWLLLINSEKPAMLSKDSYHTRLNEAALANQQKNTHYQRSYPLTQESPMPCTLGCLQCVQLCRKALEPLPRLRTLVTRRFPSSESIPQWYLDSKIHTREGVSGIFTCNFWLFCRSWLCHLGDVTRNCSGNW